MDSPADRLYRLNKLVRENRATKDQEREFMFLLNQEGAITDQEFKDYINEENVQALIKGALVAAGFLLIGVMLDRLLSKN